MSWEHDWLDLCFAPFPICLNSTRHKGAHMLCCLYDFTFISEVLEQITCPKIRLCLKEQLPIWSAETSQRIRQVISNQGLSWISTPVQPPPISWPAMGREEEEEGVGEQTISGNLNLFKVTERVRETDWHWWDQTRAVRCCAALRPGRTSLIDRVWWDCHWARRAAGR